MIDVLESWTQGRWWAGSGDAITVHDAVTGEGIAQVSTTGLDSAGAVAYARRVGGPELCSVGFSERAAMVKSLGLVLKEHRDELIELSARSGATAEDASVDVDGGISTALVFASKGKKALPEGNVLPEGEVEPLGKGGTFVGHHLLTPSAGLTLQINAFNFPVWGMLEKLAPALIAGVPTIVKPATPTAYIAERAVRIMAESGHLPDGALQLISGSVGDLLDHLDGRDSVYFTGSAGTAAKLRGHEAVTQRSVRFNAESDSLNASVLGTDAVPGTPEFDLFADAVAFEMRCKAGQRCTAIRRVLVPEHLVGDVRDAVVERLRQFVIGAPGAPGVTLGALVSRQQRDDTLAAVEQIARGARVVFGGGTPDEVVGAEAASASFMSPTLLVADDVDASEPHDVEAFGPVATLFGYRDLAHASELLARGGGSLVASVASYDPEVVRQLVLGGAAHHGRILVLDRDNADENTGHGTPMPHLKHGGPGRAGGGEEEGGMRAVVDHLQRTAIQGSPSTIESLSS